MTHDAATAGKGPVPSRPAPSGRWWTRRRWLGTLLLAIAGAVAAYTWWDRRGPTAPVEIFQGVTYGCDRLESTDEGYGLVHWVCVDLAAPGIELYVTPLDPDAVSRGWQYRLRPAEEVLRQEHLSVLINGTLFTSDSGWFDRSGDLARAVETTVADGHVSHIWQYTYLLWFDDRLNPRLETSTPPPEEALRKARWGIGGQAVWLRDGAIWSGAERKPNAARTAIGIDPGAKRLYAAVFENASPRRALEKLAALGARDGMLLDGGHSSTIAIGAGARGVRPGVLIGGWRPLATYFGIRARPLSE
jgi:hypothetical protein